MAITIDQQGSMNTVPTRPVQPPRPAPDATLAPRLAKYGAYLRKDRRRRYLGLSAVVIGLLWLALAMLVYFDAGFPLALPLGLVLTLLIPAVALLYEAIRQPTPQETARTLDALLDNRQRVLTSVELLDDGRRTTDDGLQKAAETKSAMESAQLSSTARLLGAIEPRILYPARVPAPQLAIAGGLLVVALGIWLLKGANDDFALATGGLPAGIDTAGVVATPTADAGLPPAPGAQPEELLPEGSEDLGSNMPGLPPGPSTGEGGEAGESGNNPSVPADVAQQQADASREAEKSLQRLSRALDEQGVTQSIADSLRQGDYESAGNALSELGENNDQLSQDAKEALAESLDKAADDSAATPDLQQAEREAADALRNGTYGEIKEAMKNLGETVKGTGDDVIPQEDLARNFPDQPAGNPTPPASQPGQQDGGAGEPGQEPGEQAGESGEPGQPGENQGGIPQPSDSGGEGQSDGSAGAPSDNPGGAPGDPNAEGQGSGAGDPGLPGEGSRVDGPRGQNLDAAGDPFELEGESQSDPNNLRPGDGEEPPAMTLEGEEGNSGTAQSPSEGGPVDATGETFPAPIDRWGILQRYFSPEGQ